MPKTPQAAAFVPQMSPNQNRYNLEFGMQLMAPKEHGLTILQEEVCGKTKMNPDMVLGTMILAQITLELGWMTKESSMEPGPHMLETNQPSLQLVTLLAFGTLLISPLDTGT